MGAFELPTEAIGSSLGDKMEWERDRDLPPISILPHDHYPQMVLMEDSGLELGTPGVASLVAALRSSLMSAVRDDGRTR